MTTRRIAWFFSSKPRFGDSSADSAATVVDPVGAGDTVPRSDALPAPPARRALPVWTTVAMTGSVVARCDCGGLLYRLPAWIGTWRTYLTHRGLRINQDTICGHLRHIA